MNGRQRERKSDRTLGVLTTGRRASTAVPRPTPFLCLSWLLLLTPQLRRPRVPHPQVGLPSLSFPCSLVVLPFPTVFLHCLRHHNHCDECPGLQPPSPVSPCFPALSPLPTGTFTSLCTHSHPSLATPPSSFPLRKIPTELSPAPVPWGPHSTPACAGEGWPGADGPSALARPLASQGHPLLTCLSPGLCPR